MKKSVVVVEDDRGLREQLVQILETASDIKCLGAYASAEEALPQILAKNPDVVLMDIKLPGMSGIQCVVEIKKVMPTKQIIMVTVYEDSERIFRALKSGANGYLVKSSPCRSNCWPPSAMFPPAVRRCQATSRTRWCGISI